jgi:hypothetical protein
MFRFVPEYLVTPRGAHLRRVDARLHALCTMAVVAVSLTACATTPAPTPAPEPAPSSITAASVPRPTPPTLIPGVSIDTNALLDAVPAFASAPLMTWGPLPQGEVHVPAPMQYDVQHQTVSVWFDWAKHAVEGSTTLRVAALDVPLASIDVDAIDMTI